MSREAGPDDAFLDAAAVGESVSRGSSTSPPSSAAAAVSVGGTASSSVAPVVAAEASLRQFFVDLRSYMNSEMAVQCEEWRFVDHCNAALRARYAKLSQRADVVLHSVEEARRLLERLPEYYGKIDDLERSLDALELVTNGLEKYSAVLEAKYCSGESVHPVPPLPEIVAGVAGGVANTSITSNPTR